MDDKAFVVKYVSDESERINQALKDVFAKGETPSDAEKDALFSDMEATLRKLTSALEFLAANAAKIDNPTDEKEELPVA